jgi:hypothetical protein
MITCMELLSWIVPGLIGVVASHPVTANAG